MNISALSEYSFGHASSNVSADDVGDILAAFGVQAAWSSITNLSKRVGLGGVPDYKLAFEDVTKKRHAAAHNVSTHTALGDLIASVDVVLGMGIGFDLLLSEARERLNTANGFKPGSADAQLDLRFLNPHPDRAGQTREQTETTKVPQKLRTSKVYVDLVHARASALANSKSNRQHLIEWDASGKPLAWTSL